jgi:hypothetical protein
MTLRCGFRWRTETTGHGGADGVTEWHVCVKMPGRHKAQPFHLCVCGEMAAA